ncbi:MAG: DUF5667 domain-containing protein [Patescibacteria group bacterium]
MFKIFQTIKTLKKLKKIEPDKRWLKNQRAYFTRIMNIEETIKAARPIFFRKTAVIALTVLLVFLGIGGGAINSAQAALPSDALYPLKLFTEKIQGLLVIGNENKIDFALKLAEKRLEEIEKETERNGNSEKNERVAFTAISHAQDNLKKAETLIKENSGSGKNENENFKQIEKALKKLGKVSERKNRVAAKLSDKIPELSSALNSLDLASIKIEEEANKIIINGIIASTTEPAVSAGNDLFNLLKEQAQKAIERAEKKIRIVEEKLERFAEKISDTQINGNADNEKRGEERQEKNQGKPLKSLERLVQELEDSAKKLESAAEKLNNAKKEFNEGNFDKTIKQANEAFKKAVEAE